MTTKIQTLDEILATLDENAAAKNTTAKQSKKPKTAKPQKTHPKPLQTPINPSQTPSNSPSKLDAIIDSTPAEPLFENNKDNNRLRWLAFYYLSKRELSSHQLKQKLLNKDFESSVIDKLIDEFQQKDYQSDYRCAAMLIRESIRKNRGRYHINQSLYKAKIHLENDLGYSLDEMLEHIGESLTDGTVLDETQEINWLRLAVEARSKKYGDTVPTTPKEKAKQLRFLQYRGFTMSVCLDALAMTRADFDED